MFNEWKVFPECWGERNTEEERGSLKELPWQSGPISLCTYTRTLYLSHSPTSSSHSLSPSLALAFFVLLLALFPLTVDLGVSSPCLLWEQWERSRESGKESKCPWEWWVCMCVKPTHFQHPCASVKQNTLISNCFVPKKVTLDQNVSCQSKSSLIMILKHTAEVGHFPQGWWFDPLYNPTLPTVPNAS